MSTTQLKKASTRNGRPPLYTPVTWSTLGHGNSAVREVFGQKVYIPQIDLVKRVTIVGDLHIPHASRRTLAPLRSMEQMIITSTVMEHLEQIQTCRLSGQALLAQGDPGAGKTQHFRLYSYLAGSDLRRVNGFHDADETDLLGGERPVGPGLFQPVEGVLSAMLKDPGIGLIDEISRFPPALLDAVLMPIFIRRCIERKVRGGVESTPWDPEAMLVATMNGIHHRGSNGLPSGLLAKFLPVTWNPLPMGEEKLIASLRFGLPQAVVNRMGICFEQLVNATKPGTSFKYPFRRFSRRDFQRHAFYTRAFAEYFGGDLMKSAYLNALDVYLSRIPAMEDRQRLITTVLDPTLDAHNRPDPWPPVESKWEDGVLTIGDATMFVGDTPMPDDGVVETPFTRNLMRLVMKGLLTGTHIFPRGPTAIGITTVVDHVLRRMGVDPTEEYFVDTLGADDLMGRYFMTDRPGEFDFSDTKLRQAMRGGSTYVAKNLTTVTPEAAQPLLPVLDSGELVMHQAPQGGIQSVSAEEGFQFIGLLRPTYRYKERKYPGSAETIGTLLDRGWEFHVDYVSDEEERADVEAILTKKLEGSIAAGAAVTKMGQVYKELMALVKAPVAAGTVEVEKVIPDKSWMINWAQGALVYWNHDPSVPLVKYLRAVGEVHLVARFDGDQKVAARRILASHFPQTTILPTDIRPGVKKEVVLPERFWRQ